MGIFEITFIDREDRRKKEVEDLISKYAKKKDKDEVRSHEIKKVVEISAIFIAAQEWGCPHALKMGLWRTGGS